jgi:phosphoribosylaminoimidazole synthetase
VESTGATGFGAFAGLHPIGGGRLLASSMDSIGTKPMVAKPRGALRNCGADMAAHCINDVATCGAEPLILLDYVAANRVRLEDVAELVDGAAEVCREAGVALVGGETAELPGVYHDGELDFAATCVGIVDETAVIDGSTIEPGDAVLGFASAGVHANGFTLVRSVLVDEDYEGPDLLAPTRLYSAAARRALPTSPAAACSATCRVCSRRRRPRSSTGTAGTARPSSAGSRATSTRRSCGASSTSGSAGAPSSPIRSRESS